jgi:CBS domain-containing protein
VDPRGARGTTGTSPQGAEAGQLGLEVLLALFVVKGVATVFSYSSGGAGGIFAPSLFVGAMLGGAFGYLDVALFEHEPRQLGAFALVGMGAVFAGVIRAPITSVLIIFEMTGGYGLVLPLMLANMSAYVLARRLRPTPIYEALLGQDGIVLPKATVTPHPLQALEVRDAMTSGVVSVLDDATAGEARARLEGQTFELAPVLDRAGALKGAVRLLSLRQAPDGAPMAGLLRPVQTILADVPLDRAVVRMSDAGARPLVVLDGATASRVVGVLSITDLVRAHARVMASRPSPERTSPGSPALGLGAIRAGALARPAPRVLPGATLGEVVDRLATSSGGAVVVSGADGVVLGVVTLEEVREFLRDEPLQRVLVAMDLARPAPRAGEDAGVEELVRLSANASAVLVGSEPQVITRTELGAVVLEWFGRGARP